MVPARKDAVGASGVSPGPERVEASTGAPATRLEEYPGSGRPRRLPPSLPFPRLSARPHPCPISGQKGRRGRGVLGLPAAPGGLDRPPDSGECTAGRGPLESRVASSSRVVRSGVHHHPPLLPGNHQKEPCPYHHHRLLLLLTHAALPAQRSGPSAWPSKPIVVSTDAALCRETRKVRHCRRMQEERKAIVPVDLETKQKKGDA